MNRRGKSSHFPNLSDRAREITWHPNCIFQLRSQPRCIVKLRGVFLSLAEVKHFRDRINLRIFQELWYFPAEFFHLFERLMKNKAVIELQSENNTLAFMNKVYCRRGNTILLSGLLLKCRGLVLVAFVKGMRNVFLNTFYLNLEKLLSSYHIQQKDSYVISYIFQLLHQEIEFLAIDVAFIEIWGKSKLIYHVVLEVNDWIYQSKVHIQKQEEFLGQIIEA